MGTKERILEAAVDLFSERGYSEVGIRDIARAVGIKESSLYSHYAGKKQLFDAILEDLQNRVAALTPTEEQAADAMAFISLAQLQQISTHSLQLYFGDEQLLKLWRILSLERLKNPGVQALYQRLLIDDPIRYQAGLFAMLMDRGAMPKLDPQALAVAFYGPIYLIYVRHIETSRSPRPLEGGMVAAMISAHMTTMDRFLHALQANQGTENEEKQEA